MQYVWLLSRKVSYITQIRDASALKEPARAVEIDNYLSNVSSLPIYLQCDSTTISSTVQLLYYCCYYYYRYYRCYCYWYYYYYYYYYSYCYY